MLTLIERSPDTYSSFLSSVQAKYKAKSFGRAYCLATHTYQPAGSGSGQLGFRKNAVMVIESKHDRGWWRGWVVRGGDGSVIDSKDKKIGYFPSAYTKLCNAPSVRLASSSPTPSTAASAAVGTTPAANPFTYQLKPGHLPGASQLVAAAAVDHAAACMVKGVSIATARTWAAQPDVARAIVKNIGTVGPVSVKTIAILRTLLNIMGSSQEGKDGAESAGALRSPGRLALLRSLGTNTALLGIGGNSTASDKDRASIAETVFETLLYTHPLGAENVKAAKGFVARTAAELFPSDEKKSAEVSQTGALGLASLIILATSDAGSGLSPSARAERTRQSPEMASNLGDIFLTFLVDNGAGQEPARELAAVLLALARGVMASEAYRKAAIATAQKSAPEAFLHAQCLQRIMKWPANCKTESALQGTLPGSNPPPLCFSISLCCFFRQLKLGIWVSSFVSYSAFC